MRAIALLGALLLTSPAGYGQATAYGNVVVVEDDGSIVGHDNLFNLDGHRCASHRMPAAAMTWP